MVKQIYQYVHSGYSKAFLKFPQFSFLFGKHFSFNISLQVQPSEGIWYIETEDFTLYPSISAGKGIPQPVIIC